MTKDKNHININEIYDEVWNSLEIGVKDRFSDYHTFSLATSSNNKIDNRTVVLRDCDKEKKTIIFNTNNSSKKIEQIKKNNDVSLVFYSKSEKIQIRLNGKAKIHNNDKFCSDRWDNMSKQSQECYYQNINPGSVINDPNDIKINPDTKISSYFSVVVIRLYSIDWLYLSYSGHRRAKFTKKEKFIGTWISP